MSILDAGSLNVALFDSISRTSPQKQQEMIHCFTESFEQARKQSDDL